MVISIADRYSSNTDYLHGDGLFPLRTKRGGQFITSNGEVVVTNGSQRKIGIKDLMALIDGYRIGNRIIVDQVKKQLTADAADTTPRVDAVVIGPVTNRHGQRCRPSEFDASIVKGTPDADIDLDNEMEVLHLAEGLVEEGKILLYALKVPASSAVIQDSDLLDCRDYLKDIDDDLCVAIDVIGGNLQQLTESTHARFDSQQNQIDALDDRIDDLNIVNLASEKHEIDFDTDIDATKSAAADPDYADNIITSGRRLELVVTSESSVEAAEFFKFDGELEEVSTGDLGSLIWRDWVDDGKWGIEKCDWVREWPDSGSVMWVGASTGFIYDDVNKDLSFYGGYNNFNGWIDWTSIFNYGVIATEPNHANSKAAMVQALGDYPYFASYQFRLRGRDSNNVDVLSLQMKAGYYHDIDGAYDPNDYVEGIRMNNEIYFKYLGGNNYDVTGWFNADIAGGVDVHGNEFFGPASDYMTYDFYTLPVTITCTPDQWLTGKMEFIQVAGGYRGLRFSLYRHDDPNDAGTLLFAYEDSASYHPIFQVKLKDCYDWLEANGATCPEDFMHHGVRCGLRSIGSYPAEAQTTVKHYKYTAGAIGQSTATAQPATVITNQLTSVDKIRTLGQAVDSFNLKQGIIACNVSYSTDDGANWTALKTLAGVSYDVTKTELGGGFGNIEHTGLRFKFDFTSTGDNLTSIPYIEAIDVLTDNVPAQADLIALAEAIKDAADFAAAKTAITALFS